MLGRVAGDDPARWPVVVRDQRRRYLWRRYDCGMVEFLVRTLHARLDECPLGDLSLWGKASVTFLTQSEEQRRLKAGLDPWTGEPDPYAGMLATLTLPSRRRPKRSADCRRWGLQDRRGEAVPEGARLHRTESGPSCGAIRRAPTDPWLVRAAEPGARCGVAGIFAGA